jgi:hypothetical protein
VEGKRNGGGDRCVPGRGNYLLGQTETGVGKLGSSTDSRGRVSALNPIESNLIPESNYRMMNRDRGTDYRSPFPTAMVSHQSLSI